MVKTDFKCARRVRLKFGQNWDFFCSFFTLKIDFPFSLMRKNDTKRSSTKRHVVFVAKWNSLSFLLSLTSRRVKITRNAHATRPTSGTPFSMIRKGFSHNYVIFRSIKCLKKIKIQNNHFEAPNTHVNSQNNVQTQEKTLCSTYIRSLKPQKTSIWRKFWVFNPLILIRKFKHKTGPNLSKDLQTNTQNMFHNICAQYKHWSIAENNRTKILGICQLWMKIRKNTTLNPNKIDSDTIC